MDRWIGIGVKTPGVVDGMLAPIPGGPHKVAQGHRMGSPEEVLFKFDFSASGFEFCLGFLGGFFGDAFEDLGGSAFDELLGIGEAETRRDFAHSLNDGNFVAAGFGDDDVEFGFLLGGFGRTSGDTGGGYGSCGGDAPGFFELFNEIDGFQDGKLAEFFCELCNV